jgi:alpha-D-ribose 1-methylphosphonate 5-triphosphate diphosphatase
MDNARKEQELIIRGGMCLLPGQGLGAADIVCAGGKIAEIRATGSAEGRVLDAHGCLVLPGIVDIHGDAFERQIMPRPKTTFPLDMALLETDRQLAANGISTAYHGITVSWEPGLRSLEQALKIVDALDMIEGQCLVDHRLHIRWETFAHSEMPAIEVLFARRKKPLLAFNDHTSPTLAGARAGIKVQGSAERAMMDVSSYMALLEEVGRRAANVPQAIAGMAAAARAQGVPLLSHDDMTPEMRGFYRALGAGIAEFPMTREALDAAAEAGDVIVLGSPNVVRGGSHNGAIGAEQAVREGKCSVLASDYYYPAPLRAALSLAERVVLPLETAWNLVSASPAAACGLSDRGRIEGGKRADLVIVSADLQMPVATLVEGRAVYRIR